ncbi:hypothetical protein [Rhodococcus sp. IEGM 1379]|uniref:hypothetical protein n=1 Tax=Rhodococcus sp. IEGM 1379 TaxID=3047086 RepID=UPI0024B8334C|nr:hypothetical protein [Rhodococcus sp. IEGM 1379]MDI9914365.1 hypothetical protein [Rhodococcus sp. IEGM 1379]
MAVAPALYVAAPTLTPSRFGLVTAADLVVPEDRHFVNGVQFESNPSGPAKLTAAECLESPGPDRTVPDGIEVVEADPIIVYNGFTCRAVGVDESEMLDRARKALTGGEWAAVEKALPLMTADTDIFTTTAVPLVKGIGLLEDHLTEQYGGVGVIHAPRHVAMFAAERRQIDVESGRKVTTLGTRWSFGNYPNTDADGDAAAVDTAWLVATGAVQVRRSEVKQRPVTLADALDRRTNEVFAIAERTYVVSWETVQAAVLVNLTSS